MQESAKGESQRQKEDFISKGIDENVAIQT
jgi:hypothetical protein